MRWSRALSYVALAALLAAVLWVTTPPPPPPAPAASPERRPDIVGVSVSAGDRRISARRVDGRWQVAAPHGDAVTSDLVDALLAAVLDAPAEAVAPADAGDEFGLDQPFARIELERREGRPVTVLVGHTNPANTGVYGQLVGNPQILLMGLNVRYYVELMTR
ncbi:DUF4340 domain-containing protein [bacterium]|nr:DUF4340 domain-containing protein [bacterium]